jgi:hypothetical protein
MKIKLIIIVTFALCLFGILYFALPMKAAVTHEWTQINEVNTTCNESGCSYDIEITEAGAIICTFHGTSHYTPTKPTFYLDNLSPTYAFDELQNDYSGGWTNIIVAAKYDVPIGSHSIRIYPVYPYDNRSVFKCFFDNEISDFDHSTEVIAADNTNSWNNHITLSGAKDKIVYSVIRHVIGNGGPYSPDIFFTPEQSYQTYGHGLNNWNKLKIYNYVASANSINQELNYYPNSAGSDHAVLKSFIFNSVTPVEYCGDTFCQTMSEDCSSCPIDCGECVSTPTTNNRDNLFFFSNPYTFSNQSTAKVNYLYDENKLTPYDYIEIRKISENFIDSTFVATSTIIEDSIYSFGKHSGRSYFNLIGSATTTGMTYYEVIGHLAAHWSMSLGNVEATTTIPYVVAINWQSMTLPTVADILSASSTNPFYDDIVMYEAACSEEDWNTPPPEIFGVNVPALNLTVIGCKFKLGLIIGGNKFTTMATDGIYRAGNILKNVFPFNIYTNLNNSWKASSNATVMPELAFLSPVEGNLTVQIPTIGTSTATIVLWGKDIFTSSSTLGTVNAEKTNQLFLAIKTIIKWALWGLFGLWAIKNGKAFIDKMTGGQ